MPVGNESALIQLAQFRFPVLAISNAKILVYFSNKIYENNLIKQRSETVVVCNYQNDSLRKKILCHLLSFSAHFRSLLAGKNVAEIAHFLFIVSLKLNVSNHKLLVSNSSCVVFDQQKCW